MTEKYYSIYLLFFITAFITKVNAQDAPVLTFNIPYQNNLMYNRFLFNPSFSFVRENETYVSLYHRNQWVQFDDSPKVYMLAYTGKFSDRAGLGFGIYKQNIGVISNFGGIGNYSYNVRIKERMDLTIGFNVAYYNSGVDKAKAITGEPDPTIIEMQNNSLLSIKPGINLSYKDFDIGFYAENFVDYDFRSNGMAKDFANKTYSGHVFYSHKLMALKNLFEDSEVKLGLRARTSEEFGFGVGGSASVNFPRMGWVQTSIDDFYGIGVGVGFHFTKRLSLGYTYESTVKEGLSNLGPSHEITMVFAIKDKIALRQKTGVANDTLAMLEEELNENTVAKKDAKKPDFDKAAELEKLKMDLDESEQYLIDALIEEDSLATLKKEEFDKKVKNLMDYAAREKEAKKDGGVKTLEMKNVNPGEEIEDPETLEDLKKAKSGYYVISKPKNVKSGDKTVLIERYPSFVEAANATQKKIRAGIEKDPYIIHVDNSPATEEENMAIDGAAGKKRAKVTISGSDTHNSGSLGNNEYEDINSYSDNSQPVSTGSNASATRATQTSSGKPEKISNSSNPYNGIDPHSGETQSGQAQKKNETENTLVQNGSNAPDASSSEHHSVSLSKEGTAEKYRNDNQSYDPHVSGNQDADGAITHNKKETPTTKSKTAEKPKTVESLKTEEEIKDYYAGKTDKLRQAPKKGNKLTVTGVEPGYYIIANVFSEQENTDKFIRKMKDRGIEAGFFMNPDNGFRYVYLKKHSSWRDALISYYSNVNNTYFESVWLMSINTN